MPKRYSEEVARPASSIVSRQSEYFVFTVSHPTGFTRSEVPATTGTFAQQQDLL